MKQMTKTISNKKGEIPRILWFDIEALIQQKKERSARIDLRYKTCANRIIFSIIDDK